MQSLDTARKLANVIAVLTLGLFAFTFIASDEFSNTDQFGCATLATEVCDTRDIETMSGLRGYTIFRSNCMACHRLNQKLIGPALSYSIQVRDSVWLRKMIRNANDLIKSGDTLAITVYNEYNQLPHTSFEGFSDEELNDLIDYLKQASEESMVID
ncbi:c-type cytochrome [Ohtaekwangia kribbensis]|jgi:cytochrome c1|uniref:C-type cytochrome n=1 Tax=Ohtaekwangia kribbensis TaxID=688913 RepID=A0ABW3K4J7_9BACT